MTDETTRLGMQRPSAYSIRVEGLVADRWKDWFNAMTISVEGSANQEATSTLEGVVEDQAALLGLLQQLYDLGFPLLQVERKKDSPDDPNSASTVREQ